MSLEGLRAWIGEIERKLGKRTRVFLALSVIAIGLSGAAIYLAIDARESSVSESDVQELQRQLEAQIDEAARDTSTPAEPLEPTEPAPEAEPREPQPKSGQNGKREGTGGVGAGGASAGEAGATAPDRSGSKAKVQELLERAKEQNAEAEAEQAGK
jgi:type II secretory pathway pseudopilin PulG